MAVKKIPEFLTDEEQNKLLNVFNIRYISSHRNKTMIKTFLDSGLRLAEAINLKWQHMNLMTGQLKVVDGKGKKDRILWINEDTVELLRVWKDRQSIEHGKVEYVFTSRTGNRLIDRDVREMVAKYSIKAGIIKKISPHSLRHTFASDLLRATKNIVLVQKALGHADLSSTMIYTHIVDDELEIALKQLRTVK